MNFNDLSQLEKRLGYTFTDKSLLDLALTHRSCGRRNNERLEFLGDSIVNFVIAEALFRQFPKAREGQLSRLRARMVRGATLAEFGQEFHLSDVLRLGSGELKSGGYRRESIQADAIEAIIGAIFLDGGMAICRERILSWFNSRLASLSVEDQQNKDPKTRLQEFLQGHQQSLPKYSVTAIEGDAHEQFFTVICELEGLKKVSRGEGSSRRGAEQQAARKALEMLGA